MPHLTPAQRVTIASAILSAAGARWDGLGKVQAMAMDEHRLELSTRCRAAGAIRATQWAINGAAVLTADLLRGDGHEVELWLFGRRVVVVICPDERRWHEEAAERAAVEA